MNIIFKVDCSYLDGEALLNRTSTEPLIVNSATFHEYLMLSLFPRSLQPELEPLSVSVEH